MQKRKPKKPNVPIAVEREVERLRKRVADLEKVAKQAHDLLADLGGYLGPSFTVIDIDGRAFRDLVRVLYIEN